jgi:hypothetical protein
MYEVYVNKSGLLREVLVNIAEANQTRPLYLQLFRVNSTDDLLLLK